MTRKLKVLGLALVVALAFGTVAASAAFAVSYSASSYPTTGTAESSLGNDVIKTEAGNVECRAHFAGTLTTSSRYLTVSPTYTSCKAFGFLSASLVLNGCDYLFKEPFGSAPNYIAKVDVECPYGKEIVISAGTCKMGIGSQFTGGSVGLTNLLPADMSLKMGLTGIEYRVIEDGFACPFGGTGPKTGATYTQGSALTFASTNGAWLYIV